MHFFKIIFFIIGVNTALLLGEFLKKHKADSEVVRKIPHIFIGLIFTISPFFLNKIDIILFGACLIIGIFANNIFNFYKAIFVIKRISLGVLFFPVSLVLNALLFLPNNIAAFVFGFLVLTFSDSLASIFGKKFGKKRFVTSHEKTILGSLVFFLSTFLLLVIFSLFVSPLLLWKIFIISSALTIIEYFFVFGLDNIVLPVFAAYLLILF